MPYAPTAMATLLLLGAAALASASASDKFLFMEDFQVRFRFVCLPWSLPSPPRPWG